MQTVADVRSFKDSAVNQVLSQEKIPPLDLGAVLSIYNNSHHPIFKNTAGVRDFVEARAHLESALHHMLEAFPYLAQHPVEMRELKNAYAFTSGYLYIIATTLDIPQNARLEKIHAQRESEILSMFKSDRAAQKGGVK